MSRDPDYDEEAEELGGLATARAGKPARIADSVVAQIRARASRPLARGEQKVIALDLGVSPQHVCQILKGKRRACA